MRVLPDYCLRYHQNSEFHCGPCKKTFRSKEAILQHLSNLGTRRLGFHQRENNYSCKCKETFSSKDDFVNHLQFGEVHISSLHNCICQNDFKASQKLCRYAEDLDRKCRSHDVATHENCNEVGDSPLHCAILNKFYKCARDLLKWGANPNKKDGFGWTPVHLAVARGNVNVVLKLLAHDGNLFELNDDGQTPYDIAKKNVKQQILQALFIFREQGGVVQATGMKNRRLAEQVIRQFEDFKNGTRIQVPASLPGSLLAENYDVDNTEDDDDEDNDEQQGRPISYEQLMNEEATKLIYSEVVEHGKEKITHGKILVLGAVGSGKSSLVRSLSGKEFKPGRVETEGIDSCFVNTVNLDQTWQEVEDTGWTCDEAVARRVAECLLGLLMEKGSLSGSMKQLAIADSPTSSTSLQCTASNPISIEEPVKERIIKKLENPECSQDQFKLTIWDFAGHDLYQTMHHIFLSTKSMHILCFSLAEFKKDPHRSLQELDFWLNSIAAHKSACEPAVFVVATHIDCEDDDTLKRANENIKSQLFKKFPTFFVACNKVIAFPIDNTKGPNDELLKNLQLAVQKEARKSEDCIDEMAVRWLLCEKELYRLIHDDVSIFSKTKEELSRHLEDSKCKPSTDDEFQKMLETFHHSGILWLPELLVKNNGSIGDLADIVILNVQYLMDAMTAICQLCHETDTILSDRHHRKIARSLKSDAKILHSDLKKILDSVSAPTDQLIELLRIFNILLPAKKINLQKKDDNFNPQPNLTSTPNPKKLSRSEDCSYIIPSLLHEISLESWWKQLCGDSGEFQFYIDFFEFVPQAVFHQLLVQLSEYSVQTGSFDPVLSKFDAIFGFNDRFTFRLEFNKSLCQVKGSLKADCSGQPGELMFSLKEILNSVCENFFRFQKFKIGPKCPQDNCLGSNPDGSEIKRFFSRSDDVDGSVTTNSRPFVIDFNPKEARPIHCLMHRVDKNEEVNRWLLRSNSADESNNESNQDHEWEHSTSVDSGMDEALSASLIIVDKNMKQKISEKLGGSWISLGRCLEFSQSVDVDAKIDNIQNDYKDDQREQAYQLLSEWCKDKGDDATVGKLKEALNKCKRADLADSLRRFSFSEAT